MTDDDREFDDSSDGGQRLFDLVATVSRYYRIGRDVFGLGLGEFFAWADAMPEVQRGEDMREIRVLTIAGQRGLADKDYRRVIKEMEKPVRRKITRRAPPEVLEQVQGKVAEINTMISALG